MVTIQMKLTKDSLSVTWKYFKSSNKKINKIKTNLEINQNNKVYITKMNKIK